MNLALLMLGIIWTAVSSSMIKGTTESMIKNETWAA